jgi:predicted signal transduction protein with EAL and GGDEF domain
MCENGMPMVQATVVRAVSVLGDSLGVSTVAAGVQSAQLAYVRSEGCSSVQGFGYAQGIPAAELATLLVNLIPSASADDSDRDRSMQLKQNVAFCHNSARRKSCRGPLMDAFSRHTQ